MEEQIKGIDMFQGLANVAGDKETYRMVLEVYLEEGEEKTPQLLDAKDKDIKLFTIHIHAVKSASNNIGAVELGEKARLLEMAGKEEDTAYIEDNFASFLDEFKCLLKAVKEYLSN